MWVILLENNGNLQSQFCSSFRPNMIHTFREGTCYVGADGSGFKASCNGVAASIARYATSTCTSSILQSAIYPVGCPYWVGEVRNKILCQDTSKVTSDGIDYKDYVYYT